MATSTIDSELCELDNAIHRPKSRSSTGERLPRRPDVASDRATVLVADDESVTLKSLSRSLAKAGYLVIEARDGREAMTLMTSDVAVALLDLRMPKADGFECLGFIRKNYPDTQVIVNTGDAQISDAVQAMKQGAFEFVTKSFGTDRLLCLVNQAAKTAQLARDNHQLREAVASPMPPKQYIAIAPTSIKILEQVETLGSLESNVLLTGESGTGKTTLARLIHQKGSRASHPFVTVNCASLPRDLVESELFGHAKGAFTGATCDRPGRIEMADGGTLFLDEIGDLPLELQPKLLTFLQDRTFHRVGSNKLIHVDVRMIAATHQDLAIMCQEKSFREDLFFRLCVITLRIPALRERREDIPALAQRILDSLNQCRSSSPVKLEKEALASLRIHHWPGNVRELENVLERAAAFCTSETISQSEIVFDQISSSSLDAAAPALFSLANRPLVELERQGILDTLEACNGNKAMTARNLGISEKSIYNKIKRLGLSKQINATMASQTMASQFPSGE